MNRDRDERPADAAAFAAQLREATAAVAPAATSTSSGGARLDDPRFSALDSGVLVDLAGNALPEETPIPRVADLEEEPEQQAPAPRPAPPRAAALDEPDLEAPPRRIGRVARWLIPVPLLAAAAFYGVPRLTAARDVAQAVARPTALVQFDVTPRGSQLYLDGAPLASNPISLGKGEMHTVTAVASGYDVAASKFFVDEPKTVRLKLERGRGHR
jgi:hypothetical protein